MKKKSKKQVRKRLTAGERKRLVEAVTELTTTLEWTVSQLARHLGYTTPRLLYRVRSGTVGVDREKFREIMRLYEGCVLPSEVLSREDSAPGDAPQRPTERASDVAAHSNGKKDLLSGDTPVVPPLNQGLSIFVYLQSAREQLDEVLVTFEDALKHASNVLTAPGVREFQKRVRRIQEQLDEGLAMS